MLLYVAWSDENPLWSGGGGWLEDDTQEVEEEDEQERHVLMGSRLLLD
jgi:hypothetical protein